GPAAAGAGPPFGEGRYRRTAGSGGGHRVSHLGPRVSAYVDGQMPATEAEYAQAHLAMCPECQAQVLAEGASRRAARQAQPVRAGEELTQRLLALGAEPPQDFLPEGAAPAAQPRLSHV